jgi:hypothetical protein
MQFLAIERRHAQPGPCLKVSSSMHMISGRGQIFAVYVTRLLDNGAMYKYIKLKCTPDVDIYNGVIS